MSIIFATKTTAGTPITFKFVRGARWDDDVQITDEITGLPVDLTGIVRIIMRVRATIGGAILLELSDALGNDRLVLTNALTGSVGIRVNSATTLGLPENGHRKAKYLYDAVIERTPDEYEPAIGGKVSVLPQVTRPWAAT